MIYIEFILFVLSAQHIKVNEMSNNSLLPFYVEGIRRRSQGVCNEIGACKVALIINNWFFNRDLKHT